MLSFSVGSAVISKLLNHQVALEALNRKLESEGYPRYYNGGTSFDTGYAMVTPPRYVVSFRGFRPRIDLTRIYVVWLAEDMEIAFDLPTNSIAYKFVGKRG